MSIKETLHTWSAFLKRLVPVDLLIRALPLLVTLLGIGIYALSFWISAQSPWHDAMKGVGQAILAGGVVTAVLNSMKYIGIFRDAVHEVIYSPEYLKTRKDLPELWNRMSTAIHEDKFPRLSSHLKDNIIKWYLPVQKDFFYDDYDRECFLEWANKEKKLL